tara:strand:- start:808 stop:1311 length:504 start_codon:yes stop_codon:yes gene_type:complete
MAILFKNLKYQIVNLFPLFLLFFISLNNFSVIELKNFKFFFINFQYIIIYYWVLKKPKTLGYGFIFLAGISTDIVLGLPMAISSLTFLSIAAVAAYLRVVTVSISLLTDWIVFFPTLFLSQIIYLIVVYFLSMEINAMNLFMNLVVTFFLYPLCWLFFEFMRLGMKG